MLSKIRHKVGRYALQLGEIGAAKTDYNEGFYTNHVSNTLDLISEELRLQLLTVLTSTKNIIVISFRGYQKRTFKF